MEKFNLQYALEWCNKTPGFLKDNEVDLLYNIASINLDGFVMEVGSWKGRSAIALACASKLNHLGRVICIDPHRHPGLEIKEQYNLWKEQKVDDTYNEFIENIKKADVLDWIIPIRQTSKDYYECIKDFMIPQIRMLWIDSCHQYEYTKLDFDLWSPHVVQNGYILFHDSSPGNKDYNDSAGRAAEESLIKSGKYKWKRFGQITYGEKI